MRIGALTLFHKTSDRRSISLAYWHSPHSLTWRWGLNLSRQPMTMKPFATWMPPRYGHMGFGAGIGQLLAFTAMRNNGGWQFHFGLLWHALDFSQQQPMWYRDLYRRQRDRELEADFASQAPLPPTPMPEHTTLQ